MPIAILALGALLSYFVVVIATAEIVRSLTPQRVIS